MPNHHPNLQRLDRLENYLRQDPENPHLLGDAFEAALQAGELARAEFHLRHAQSLHLNAPAWQVREAHWLMAQSRWDEADQHLRALVSDANTPAAAHPALAQDLAYVALRRGDFATGLAQLAPSMDAVAANEPIEPSLQVLWLRLLHRLHRHADAMAWATARWQAQQLHYEAAGVASLIALDADDGGLSLQWADHALRHDEQQLEALVARATLALGQTNAALSRTLLNRALQQNANDGRTLSALGFTELLELHLDAARTRFEQAVQSMPSHIGTWHGLGWTLLLQGDLQAARQAFDTALALDRNFGESHGGLAVVQAMLGQRAEAEQSIERAVRLDRAGVSAHYAQAVLRGEARDMQAIRRLATRLLGGRAALTGHDMLDVLQRAMPAMKSPGNEG